MDQETRRQTQTELESASEILLRIRDQFMDVPSLEPYAEDLLSVRDTLVRIEHRLHNNAVGDEAKQWAKDVAEALGITSVGDDERWFVEEEDHATEESKTESTPKEPTERTGRPHHSDALFVARTKRGLSVRELSRKADVHRLTIEHIESGRTKYPTHATMAKLDKALGTNHLKEYAWNG